MSEPDESDQDDAFRYWRHQLEKRDPLGTMIIQRIVHFLVLRSQLRRSSDRLSTQYCDSRIQGHIERDQT
jgi:hypothetical protein